MKKRKAKVKREIKKLTVKHRIARSAQTEKGISRKCSFPGFLTLTRSGKTEMPEKPDRTKKTKGK